jgi:hypothetical protein
MSLLLIAYPTIAEDDVRWIQQIRARHDRLQYKHYSCTCLERQEGRPTTWLSELERSHVGLKFGSHLLETVDRQMISGAQIVLVVVPVHGAIS